MTKLLLGIALSAGISSCDNAPELSLPPATQEGKNMLGFKANGKAWVNHGEICNYLDCDDNVVEGRLHKNADGTHTLVLQAHYTDKKKNILQVFTIGAYDVSKPGSYTLTAAHQDQCSLILQSTQNNFFHLVSDSRITLQVTRLDTVQHIVSGTFEGVLDHYSDATNKMTITEGRFDTKLTYSW